MTIRVLVVDDQPLIRAGLVALFHAAPGIEVAGEAADGEQAIALAAQTRPDVILMDVRMPNVDGIAATRTILTTAGEPRPHIVVLTTFDLDEYVYAALAAGASGFLLKDTPPQRIIGALHTIVAGDILLTPRITHRLIEAYSDRHRTAIPGLSLLRSLTARETEVLRLVGNGLSNAEIAERLVLSEQTVKTHVKRMMGKLGVASRAQAVVVAYESGLVVPAPAGDRGNGRPGQS
ncbi:response regulator transcription factor [Actinoplanes sp. N902-109]|uniref:response regulator n=1 Tax=Actinoplanes sp. (strain N902-109) TaxID=649831 RepID=UPI0003294AA2|nr:response regulator transcription factor [Actinoplanes sp. N902-109]AGL16351.1 two-component system, regulatory protein [Actinoplanes sp. N902-109]